jgi:hypothetical protein
MSDLGPLMRQQKHDEAEVILDRALKLLGDDGSNKENANK